MDVATRLRAAARAANERRAIVIAGDREAARDRATQALDTAAIDRRETTYLGSGDPFECESLAPREADEILGETRDALILDCHERFEPNALGRVIGTIAGGGLHILLTPPLDDWPTRRDAFDDTLAVPPFETEAVTGQFRRRLVETLRIHPGIAIVDAETGTVVKEGTATGRLHSIRTPDCCGSSGQVAGSTRPLQFPQVVYDRCRTADQREALNAFEQLRTPGSAVVVESDRGRGKSSAAGLAAVSLALEGDDVLVTAPQYRSTRELFARARELLEIRDALAPAAPNVNDHTLRARDSGRVRFAMPTSAVDLPDDPDHVIVDEAAAVPVDLLRSVLTAQSVAFTTTVHGYEGTGRGFSVRFMEHLEGSDLEVTTITLDEPIRYAAGDPIEVWSFRALALDASPPAAQLVADCTPDSVTYRELSSEELYENEALLDEVFGLLVLAHYRTEPNDLARMLDAPNVSVHALFEDGHPVSVALLAREGGLPPGMRADIYEGATVRGNLIPDLLAGQLRDQDAPALVGHRILRIVTHEAAQSRGLGSLLLDRLREYADGDWLGVAYGATPDLVNFWRQNDFGVVHLGTSRDDRSGEHSAIMLDPLTDAGSDLHDRHAAWFRRRFPGTLADTLSTADPDVIRTICRATPGTVDLDLDLDPFEWRLVTGIPHGAGFFDTAPQPIRRLAYRHLLDSPDDAANLDARAERLLVTKALQCRSWHTVTEDLDFPSVRACRRALGDATEELVATYGDEFAHRECDRY